MPHTRSGAVRLTLGATTWPWVNDLLFGVRAWDPRRARRARYLAIFFTTSCASGRLTVQSGSLIRH